jgi:predicted acylesterase/phospholipase RssA
VRRAEEVHTLFDPSQLPLSYFDPRGSLRRKLTRLFRTGHLMDSKKLAAALQRSLGDVTFREAYERTGRVLNIAVTATRGDARLLNYLTSPWA